MSERTLKADLNAANAEAQQYLDEVVRLRKENTELHRLLRDLRHQLALIRLVVGPRYLLASEVHQQGSEG